MPDKPIAIILTGPTAIGKTALSFGLTDATNAEIISVDSAQVYRGMDIGTAKPDNAVRARFPHHLIDIRDPAEAYSAAEFRRDCLATMEALVARGKTPLLVGGTMLYLKALLEGLAELPGADESVRADISRLAEEQGWPAVHAELEAVDPQTAARLNPTDSQRLQRALEVYRVSGRPLSAFYAEQQPSTDLPFRFIQFALVPEDRAVLHERIDARFRQMIEEGLVDEVRTLYGRGDLTPSLPSIRSVGYRQIWAMLQGDYGLDEAINRGIIATRQLAKRQHTWLRSWQNLNVLTLGTDSRVITAQGPDIRAKRSTGEQLDVVLACL